MKSLQMKDIQKEMEQWIDEKEKLDKENPYDKTIANAIANSNVEMTIKKNQGQGEKLF